MLWLIPIFLNLAAPPSIPVALKACGIQSQDLPLFFRLSTEEFEAPNSLPQLVNRWDQACEEFEDPRESEVAAHAQGETPWWVSPQVIATSIYTGLFSLGLVRLDDSAVEKEYQAALDRIRLTPHRAERVKQVFQLARKYQGQGDPENPLQYLHPGRILRRAAAGEPGGVCREFAVLLYWSLLQVARPEGAKLEQEFTPEIRYGATHWWVRVHFPKSKGQKLESFNIDTTDYLSFVPLQPRQDKELMRWVPLKKNWCQKTIRCLRDQLAL